MNAASNKGSGAPTLKVLVNDERPTPSNMPIRGLEEALLRAGVPAIYRRRPRFMRKVCGAWAKTGMTGRIRGNPKTAIVAALAWSSDSLTLPHSLWCELTPWIFDCWGPQFPRWEALFRRHKVRDAFFSARGAAEHFGKLIPDMRSHWLPEAIDLQWIDGSKSLAERSTQVMEMGRGYRAAHDAITGPLAERKVKHRYQVPGEPLQFPTLQDLHKAMGDTAVMVCYPKTMTHPENAGGVETATQRYFEAIGSRCVVAGHCPAELRDLFGFDPIIDLPKGGEARRLLEVLDNLGSFQGHVDRAHARLLEVGTFDARAKTLLETWNRVRRGG